MKTANTSDEKSSLNIQQTYYTYVFDKTKEQRNINFTVDKIDLHRKTSKSALI